MRSRDAGHDEGAAIGGVRARGKEGVEIRHEGSGGVEGAFDGELSDVAFYVRFCVEVVACVFAVGDVVDGWERAED